MSLLKCIIRAFKEKFGNKNYILIFILTTFFLCLFIYSLGAIQKEIILLTEENQDRIIQETKTKTFNWISFAKKNIEGSAKYLVDSGMLENRDNIGLYLNDIKVNFDDFDIVQLLLIEEDIIITNDGKTHPIKDIEQLNWFWVVHGSLKTKTSTMGKHATLQEKTMNICTPVISNENLVGVLCGVIKSSAIIEKVRRLSLPENIYFFIAIPDEDEIMINKEKVDIKLKEKIQQITIDKKDKYSSNITRHELYGQLINIAPLGIFDWHIGVGIKKSDITKSTDVLFWKGISILVAFLMLVVIANAIHEYFYNSLNKKFKRVQTLIELWIKDSNRGIMLIEKNGEIAFCNTKATEYLEDINSHNQKTYNAMSSILKEQKDIRNFIKASGKIFEIYTHALNSNGEYEGVVIVIKDITKDVELEESKKEHEYIFMHQEKMMEIGELIVGINHQLKQPINGLSILMSNLLQQHSNNSLDDKTLITNIKLCQKNLIIMNNIIDLYRKYYKNSFEVTEFSIKECIRSIKDILDTKIKRNNIQLNINIEEDLSATTRENVVQQIVLVLFQNAIDATMNSKNKNITICAFEKEGMIIVDVIDNGIGIDENSAKKLFKNPVKTKKENGTGFGLYFASKLASKKINGQILLKNSKNPTIFSLEFETFYKDNENI